MGNNLTEKGAKAAQIKVQKREEALRENLKRRKLAAQKQKGKDSDENLKNRE